MKAQKSSLHKALDAPSPAIHFYLFHGMDEAQSRNLADRLLNGLGAEKRVIASEELRTDPARLADEAQAISLFGDRQLIWIEPAREEIAASVEGLLATAKAENPVVAIAGRLTRTSALLKIAESHASALSHVSYPLEGRAIEQAVETLAQAEGMRCEPGVAARIAAACGSDQRIAAQEIAKFAIFLGASPHSPKALDHDALDAVGAEISEESYRVVDLALRGDIRAVGAELAQLEEGGSDAIPMLRALQRRLMTLAPLRAKVESGRSIPEVMTSAGKSLFWKEKDSVAAILSCWDSQGLARIVERSAEAEKAAMSAIPPIAVLGEELLAIARAARPR